MANDDIFTATTTWQAVQANSTDITNGTFSIVNFEDNRLDFVKSDTLPAQSDPGSSFMNKRKDSNKYTLEASEKLFVKAGSGSADIGIIQA